MSKNIVVFIDGTWNHAGADNVTNVHKLYQRAKAHAGPEQLILYLEGVGTGGESYHGRPEWSRKAGLPVESDSVLARCVRKGTGGLFGLGVAHRIKQAYSFLVDNYLPGDHIFLFGFSRGAFAIRSLAGFIDEVGLLLREHIGEVQHAYRLYESKSLRRREKLAGKLQRLTGFAKPELEQQTVLPVHLIGVWDTVGALGVFARQCSMPIFNTGYHNTRVPSNVSHARHALALHELRGKFEPLLWDECASGQSLLQVWFAGAHADVGGGYKETSLSDIALKWMADEAEHVGLKLLAPAASTVSDIPADAVHNTISGWFALFTPSIRQFVRTIPDDMARSGGRHAMHQSVMDRLTQAPLPAYRHWEDAANARLKEIDELIPLLAINLVFCSHPMVRPGEFDPAQLPTGVPDYLQGPVDPDELADLKTGLARLESTFQKKLRPLLRAIVLQAALTAPGAIDAINRLTNAVANRRSYPLAPAGLVQAERDARLLRRALRLAQATIPDPDKPLITYCIMQLATRNKASSDKNKRRNI
jgi:uncharacterized protein (DUF2235 family)